MDKTIIVAFISAIGAIVVALIGIFASRKKKETQSPSQTPSILVGNITSGGDAVIAGRDATVIREPDRFMSREGGRIVSEVSKMVIPDQRLRSKWSSFDANFLDRCLRDTQRGWIFDGQAFQEFRKQENDHFFSLSVSVYMECCRRIEDQSHKDYKAFNRIADFYWNARKVLNPERVEAVEWWFETKKENALCDDCSAPLQKGDGYMVGERAMEFGNKGQRIHLGPSLLCESCFVAYKESQQLRTE